MLFPKKVAHRKWQNARLSEAKRQRPDSKGISIDFGSFGLKAETGARVTSRQIEAARRAMTRRAGKVAKIWIRIFPDRPFTQKASEVPMGKGKGNPEGFCFEVRPGRVIFEIDGISEVDARESLRKAGCKLPIKTKIIAR